MTNDIHKAIVKRVWTNAHGRRKVLLSAPGIGDAWMGWGKTPKKLTLNPGDVLQVRLNQHDDGRWMVSDIVDGKGGKKQSAQQKKKQSKAKSAASGLKKAIGRLLKGPEGYLRKMYLHALGGGNVDLEQLEARAQSLGPFIEYVELSKQSADHLRKRARFQWERVEDQKKIMITGRNATEVRLRVEHLPYLMLGGEQVVLDESIQLIHMRLGQMRQVIRTNASKHGIEFATDLPLEEVEGWVLFNEAQTPVTWVHNERARAVEEVKINGTSVDIKRQSKDADWIHLILGQSNLDPEKDALAVDGVEVSTWDVVLGGRTVGALMDEDGRQVLSAATVNDKHGDEVEILPSGKILLDADGVEHTWKDVTKASNDVTLRIALDPKIAKTLDEDRDINPLDVLFSPDSDFREMGLHGHDKHGKFIAGGTVEGKRKDGSTYRYTVNSLRIRAKDIERQTITVDQLPPNEDSVLTLKPNTKYLERQRDMLLMLRDKPLYHHNGLLKLSEEGNNRARERLWPDFPAGWEDEGMDWEVLKDQADGSVYDGTEQQRMFVRRALNTPDYAILQGPPGSGKTTAIIELIAQCAKRNMRVLLCGSTQASIDNVLTRIKAKPDLSALISPLRIGWKKGIYDEGVHDLVLDEQLEIYTGMGFSEDEAEDLILRQSNLTCGTMAGILNHPWISAERSKSGKLQRDPQPDWDLLIIDEASKTTFQQFVIPAAFSKRWILVGDVRQLPPFLEASELMTNLDQMKDNKGVLFNSASQRACYLMHQFNQGRKSRPQPLIFIEPGGVPEALVNEAGARNKPIGGDYEVMLIGHERVERSGMIVHTPRDLEEEDAHLRLLAADIIVVGSDCYPAVAERLPVYARYRNNRFEKTPISTNREKRMEVLHGEEDEEFTSKYARHPMSLASLNHDWSHEVSWRLNRAYELKVSQNKKAKDRYEEQIQNLLPKAQDVSQRVEEIRSIALPSVLECLQYGFAEGPGLELLPETTLTRGFPTKARTQRFQVIEYQHRMHRDISKFSREQFYSAKGETKALLDANTVAERTKNHPFGFRRNRGRSTWIDVPSKTSTGINKSEIDAMEKVLRGLIDWARNHHPTQTEGRDDGARWEVALLSPYQAQRRGMRDMVRKVTGLPYETRFNLLQMKQPTNIMLTVNSSDRFQGQEADVVMISMRNATRIGFLDSPNRMNVAATRAREWRIVVGDYTYFSGEKKGRMNDPMLKAFAKAHEKESVVEVLS